jgi:hypothetical protein
VRRANTGAGGQQRGASKHRSTRTAVCWAGCLKTTRRTEHCRQSKCWDDAMHVYGTECERAGDTTMSTGLCQQPLVIHQGVLTHL